MTLPNSDSGTPANSDQGDGGGIPTTLFTQQQLDHTAAQARRGALEGFFKQIGFDKTPTAEELQATVAAAQEHEKLKAGQQSDVERLTTENATLKSQAEKIPSLEAAKRRAELAGDAGLKSRYHKYVEGSTDEEIQESIKLVLADVGGGGTGGGQEGGETPPNGQQQTQQGTGSTGGLTPNPQQGTSGGGNNQTKGSLKSGREAYLAKHGTKKE
jgi:hypothetical protein